MTAAGLTDQGCVRKQNEDNYLVDAGQGLFIVSDGMGGHTAGKLASRIVVEALPPFLSQRMESVRDFSDPKAAEIVLEVLSEFSEQLRNKSSQRAGFSGMGATLALCLIRNHHALITHMGDSRIYLLREKQLEQLTMDHSIVQLLIEAGEITPEEAVTHPARARITRYIGMKGEPLSEAHVVELAPNDRLLLCTDGLTNMLDDRVITGLLCAHPEPEAACRVLIDEANKAGGRDNITVVIVRL